MKIRSKRFALFCVIATMACAETETCDLNAITEYKDSELLEIGIGNILEKHYKKELVQFGFILDLYMKKSMKKLENAVIPDPIQLTQDDIPFLPDEWFNSKLGNEIAKVYLAKSVLKELDADGKVYPQEYSLDFILPIIEPTLLKYSNLGFKEFLAIFAVESPFDKVTNSAISNLNVYIDWLFSEDYDPRDEFPWDMKFNLVYAPKELYLLLQAFYNRTICDIESKNIRYITFTEMRQDWINSMKAKKYGPFYSIYKGLEAKNEREISKNMHESSDFLIRLWQINGIKSPIRFFEHALLIKGLMEIMNRMIKMYDQYEMKIQSEMFHLSDTIIEIVNCFCKLDSFNKSKYEQEKIALNTAALSFIMEEHKRTELHSDLHSRLITNTIGDKSWGEFLQEINDWYKTGLYHHDGQRNKMLIEKIISNAKYAKKVGCSVRKVY